MLNNILIYFIIYSILGWCLESIHKTILEKRIVNSGFLYGPFCPIYGFGAMIMIIISDKISYNIAITFIVCTIVLTVWEYIGGILLEKIFKTKYWDYSDLKFNINGRICLKNSIYWGVLGVIFVFIVHPAIVHQIGLIPRNIVLYINIIIYIIVLTDAAITITKVLFIDKKIEQLRIISDKIMEKVRELKQIEKFENTSIQSITKVINELKKQQSVLKIKLYKLMIRLKKAFPTMQSETITRFLNQKIDFKIIRNKIKKDKGE